MMKSLLHIAAVCGLGLGRGHGRTDRQTDKQTDTKLQSNYRTSRARGAHPAGKKVVHVSCCIKLHFMCTSGAGVHAD